MYVRLRVNVRLNVIQAKGIYAYNDLIKRNKGNYVINYTKHSCYF